jgi:hypothetical protein
MDTAVSMYPNMFLYLNFISGSLVTPKLMTALLPCIMEAPWTFGDLGL